MAEDTTVFTVWIAAINVGQTVFLEYLRRRGQLKFKQRRHLNRDVRVHGVPLPHVDGVKYTCWQHTPLAVPASYELAVVFENDDGDRIPIATRIYVCRECLHNYL